jgi:hypothetical protein
MSGAPCPVPGVGVMPKGPQGWVQREDHLPYYKDNASCSLPRLHDRDSTTREDPGGGARPGVQGPLEWGSWGFNAARGRCFGQLRSK